MKIVISGTVGVGKTTISKLLEKKLKNNYQVKLNLEIPYQNPYLSYYYKNRSEWSFLIQLDYMLNRFKALLEVEKLMKINLDSIAIFDRHFLDDFIFGSMKIIREDMSFMQWNQYALITKTLVSRINYADHPDYFFLLQASFENIISRINKRARKEELDVDDNYWKNLYDQYYNNPVIVEYLKSNVKNLIYIKTDDKSPEEIVDEILTYIKK